MSKCLKCCKFSHLQVYSLSCPLFILKYNLTFSADILLRNITRTHVTTHYSIVPREGDERWKGFSFMNFFVISFQNT